jgi:hypothetical protein
MTRLFRAPFVIGLTVLLCVIGLAACGSPSPTAGTSATKSPGPGDTAICQLIVKATAAYNAKNFSEWRLYMAQVGASADSAQYPPVKRYAEEVKNGTTAANTTTTKATKNKGGFVAGGALAIAGGYVGLQHACARVRASQ